MDKRPLGNSGLSTAPLALGCNERVVELVETVADELVTNAIYNAPRTPEGEPKYARRSRRDPVELEEVLTFGRAESIRVPSPAASTTARQVRSAFNRDPPNRAFPAGAVISECAAAEKSNGCAGEVRTA